MSAKTGVNRIEGCGMGNGRVRKELRTTLWTAKVVHALTVALMSYPRINGRTITH